MRGTSSAERVRGGRRKKSSRCVSNHTRLISYHWLLTVPSHVSFSFQQSILPGSHAHARSRLSSPPDASEAEHKWEDIHSSDPDSLASSYPSLSFPSDPHSPSSSAPHALPPHAHHHHHGHPHPHGPEHAPEPRREAPSTTQAVFDTSLSPRTRVLALVASLAVNIGLPFINGVMLGFGEIFAKEVLVVWFGWGKRSSSTQNKERARSGAREGGAGLRTAEWR